MPYRVKEYYCGDYLELEIFPVTPKQVKQPRKLKKKESVPKQKNLNDKNSRKYFRRLVHLNFTDEDIVIHLTYKNDCLPKTEKEAQKDVENFLRRVKYRREKRGLPKLKYLAIIEHREEGAGEKEIRIHHHVIMSGGIDRDELEHIWKKGRANADRLKADEYGYEALVNYVTKDPKGKKRWKPSLNLEKPEPKVSDYKYKKKRVEEIAKNPDDTEIFEKNYPGYFLTTCKVQINDYTAGIHLEIKLRKLKD